MPAPTSIVDAEAAWLSDTVAAPALTALLLVTPYFRHRPADPKRAELRLTGWTERRVSSGRKERVEAYLIRVVWPITAGAQQLVDDQRYLQAALDLLVDRIRGGLGDHTHGGLFLSVADGETSRDDGITVTLGDPELDEESTGRLTALVAYNATRLLLNA